MNSSRYFVIADKTRHGYFLCAGNDSVPGLSDSNPPLRYDTNDDAIIAVLRYRLEDMCAVVEVIENYNTALQPDLSNVVRVKPSDMYLTYKSEDADEDEYDLLLLYDQKNNPVEYPSEIIPGRQYYILYGGRLLDADIAKVFELNGYKAIPVKDAKTIPCKASTWRLVLTAK